MYVGPSVGSLCARVEDNVRTAWLSLDVAVLLVHPDYIYVPAACGQALSYLLSAGSVPPPWVFLL